MRSHGIPVAVVAGGAALLLLAGCTARDTEAAPSPSVDSDALVASLPAATTAVDDVTWALVEGEPRSLDPSADYSFIIPNLCDNLLQLQPDFTVEPGLATGAEWADPVTFVIDLRDDVTFWDGTPMTADDVVYSLDRNRAQTSAGSRPSCSSRRSRRPAITRSRSASRLRTRPSAMRCPAQRAP